MHHVVDGRVYVVDAHRIIREPGRFDGLPVYAPYFWSAYVDGAYGDEEWIEDTHVIVFILNDDDRREYPELAGATRLFIWEDSGDMLRIRPDRLM